MCMIVNFMTGISTSSPKVFLCSIPWLAWPGLLKEEKREESCILNKNNLKLICPGCTERARKNNRNTNTNHKNYKY